MTEKRAGQGKNEKIDILPEKNVDPGAAYRT